MAHEIHTQLDGSASMAYVGNTPWHGLGQNLKPESTIDEWIEQAGFNWDILSSPVMYKTEDTVGRTIRSAPDRNVLYRSDTREYLSTVSNKYKVVQPAQVLEFYRDLTEQNELSLETAGVLYNGTTFWALAKQNKSINILGQDRVDGYLLLATSCDGSLATTAMPTSVRVVCKNTLNQADPLNARNAVRVSHSLSFDEKQVKMDLGLIDNTWNVFASFAEHLAFCKVSDALAKEYFETVVYTPKWIKACPSCKSNEHADVAFCVKCGWDLRDTLLTNVNESKRTTEALMLLYKEGQGADLETAKGTAWGLLNAVTEFSDHHRGRNQSTRLQSAWFGESAAMKNRAFTKALQLL